MIETVKKAERWHVGAGDAGSVFADGVCRPIARTTADRARLIAAAPDLLAACYAMIDTEHGYHPEKQAALSKVRAAIAKATGMDR